MVPAEDRAASRRAFQRLVAGGEDGVEHYESDVRHAHAASAAGSPGRRPRWRDAEGRMVARAVRPGHHRPRARRGRAAQARVLRHARPGCRTAPSSSRACAPRSRARAGAAGRSRCCSSTSTTSSSSTTRSATAPATGCCAASPGGCAAPRATPACSPATAATSSCCCSATSRPSEAERDGARGGRRSSRCGWPSRSRWRAPSSTSRRASASRSSPRTPTAPRSCSSTPTWRCTRARAAAARRRRSTRGVTHDPLERLSLSRRLRRAIAAASSRCTTSRSCGPPAGACTRWRRCCAGRTPSAGSCIRTPSSRPPRRWACSTRSAPGWSMR